MEIKYIGEHLLFGKLGNAFIVLSFTAALLSAAAYVLSFLRKQDDPLTWTRMGRTAFYIHGISVIGIISLVFFLIHGHYYEYHYVWQHSSTQLPQRYMWACLWEGQEGSFLIWTFWHVVLATIIMWKVKDWEAPVMITIMLVQVFLASMLLGMEFNHLKIGSNPFILLRNHPDFANLPFIKMPEYLSKIKDGRGLNPLLQNYWMVIHPPTLFLGFASTLIPFAFAMAGLITGKVREWVRPALPWATFGILILGTGVLMGGAWAYEALSFGGFWAWDPVENASLVPWLTLVGAVHIMIINKKNGSSLTSTFVLTTITFILVLYSTFLTRSGILGNTSVHAFTDLGMSWQLLLYMLFFILMAIFLIIKNRKQIYQPEEDEKIQSREFWMFMGMLVLSISAVQITITTSIPVLNKIFGSKMAPPADAIDFYNSWQLPLAVVVSLLVAIGQFFKWKDTDMKVLYKKLLVSFIVSIIITAIAGFTMDFPRPQHLMMLFATVWAFTANLDFLIRTVKGGVSHWGASIAHCGLAFILLGALISNAEKHVISRNMLNVDLGKDFPNKENILLYQHDTLPMGDYYVTYKGKEKVGVNIYYEIEYYKANHVTGKMDLAFTLKPLVQLNNRMGNVSEPATKKFFDKDIYTHITYAELDDENVDAKQDPNAYKEPKMHSLKVGDTITTSNALITLVSLNQQVDKKALYLNDDDIAVGAQISVVDVNRKVYLTQPIYIIKDKNTYSKDTEIPELGLKFAFSKIIPEENKIEINLSEKKANSRPFVIMKAIVFPGINILWIGSLLMILGSFLSIRKRVIALRKV